MNKVLPTTDMLSIQLREAPEGDTLEVRAVDVLLPNFRHRLTFNAGTTTHDALAPPLARYIDEVTSALDSQAMVVSEPDAVVEFPGMVLGKLRVLAHRVTQDTRNLTIRFAYFIGDVQSLFSIDTHFAVPSARQQEAVAVAVLVDICSPAFEMISTRLADLKSKEPEAPATGNQLSKIEEVESELSFYLHLLQCYIASLDVKQQSITLDNRSPSIFLERNLELKSV